LTDVLRVTPKAPGKGKKIETKHIEGGEKSRGKTQQPDKVLPAIEGREKDLAL
jgi:hypothetical protein